VAGLSKLFRKHLDDFLASKRKSHFYLSAV
jgi:hypothetical protein